MEEPEIEVRAEFKASWGPRCEAAAVRVARRSQSDGAGQTSSVLP